MPTSTTPQTEQCALAIFRNAAYAAMLEKSLLPGASEAELAELGWISMAPGSAGETAGEHSEGSDPSGLQRASLDSFDFRDLD